MTPLSTPSPRKERTAPMCRTGGRRCRGASTNRAAARDRQRRARARRVGQAVDGGQAPHTTATSNTADAGGNMTAHQPPPPPREAQGPPERHTVKYPAAASTEPSRSSSRARRGRTGGVGPVIGDGNVVLVSPNGPVSISTRGDVTPRRAGNRDDTQPRHTANQDTNRGHEQAAGVGPVVGRNNHVLISPDGPVTIVNGEVATSQSGDVTPHSPGQTPEQSRQRTRRTRTRQDTGEAERRAYQAERDAARARNRRATREPGVIDVIGDGHITITGGGW